MFILYYKVLSRRMNQVKIWLWKINLKYFFDYILICNVVPMFTNHWLHHREISDRYYGSWRLLHLIDVRSDWTWKFWLCRVLLTRAVRVKSYLCCFLGALYYLEIFYNSYVFALRKKKTQNKIHSSSSLIISSRTLPVTITTDAIEFR